MCGIFGAVLGKESQVESSAFSSLLMSMFLLSESRGKEAAGIAVKVNGGVMTAKSAVMASKFVKSAEYKKLLASLSNGSGKTVAPLAVIGHSRLATNGSHLLNENNQPVACGSVVGVHNGIIVNDDDIWARFPDMERRLDVDTEALMSLVDKFRRERVSADKAADMAFRSIRGTASIAAVFEDLPELLLATNNGSLYIAEGGEGAPVFFASERYILDALMAKGGSKAFFGGYETRQIEPGSGVMISLEDSSRRRFKVGAFEGDKAQRGGRFRGASMEKQDMELADRVAALRRCKKCVLPETMPFIEFDGEGVCNYCKSYRKTTYKGEKALEEAAARFRRSDGRPDCVFAFSGGRDSSYGLHYAKAELGLNPVAYTYDWGMVNDLARRNQARMCGDLGVEHIIVSADITTKLRYIRQNVEAWLKKPDLGMIPLFMAGDKQFFYYANKIARQMDVNLIVFAASPLEKTSFKTGFCGVRPEFESASPHKLSRAGQVRMAAYYARNYLTNPAYLNSSLMDTFSAFVSYYLVRQDFLLLFEYIEWDEKDIMSLLIDEYGWETAEDTPTTWRIGDGTAPFYNYIYYKVAGFTENDTFRSNQIREGQLSREEALRLVTEENIPRREQIREYLSSIGLDYDTVMKRIDSIPVLYERG